MKLVAERIIDDLGRILVPREVRRVLGWSEGTEIAFYIQDGKLILEAIIPAKEQDTQ